LASEFDFLTRDKRPKNTTEKSLLLTIENVRPPTKSKRRRDRSGLHLETDNRIDP
jgi:hypothetical protein